MADEKILDNEILNDEELDNVAGGTFFETRDLRNAIGRVYLVKSYYDNQPIQFYSKLPPNEIAGYLKSHYDIDATLSFGKYNSEVGLYEPGGDPNTYSRNGQSLTHQQVLDIIKGK